MKIRSIFLAHFLVACLVFSWEAQGKETEKESKISSLKTFNRAVLLVKEQYVDPARIQPKKIVTTVLDALEKNIPEVVVSELPNEEVRIQAGFQSRTYKIDQVSALWDVSFILRDMLQFIEENVSDRFDAKKIEIIATNGMLSFDPHSMLLEPQYSREVHMSTKGHFGGLGIQIGLRDGYITVISPLEGTPAHKVGMLAQDKIVQIGEESAINMTLDEAVEKLRGPKGSHISLAVERTGQSKPVHFDVIRAEIKVESVTAHDLGDGIGYIHVKAFQGNTTQDIRTALNQFKAKYKKEFKGLVLDFSNNPGGLLDQSISVSDLFLNGGEVVITKVSAKGKRDVENASKGRGKEELPLAVLINGGSASASEIVAGAIKNRNRGVVIGEQSFGKGSVQMLYDFPDKLSLKLTVAEYLTPGDVSIQSVGITPDIYLRPLYVDKEKNRTDIFENDRFREEDLEAHLNSNDTQKRRPAYELAFVAEIPKDPFADIESGKVPAFEPSYQILFAKRLLLTTKGATRIDLLKAAKPLVKQAEQEQLAALEKSLKNLKIDWSNNGKPSKKGDLQFKVVGLKPSKAGENVQLTVEATNVSKTTAHRIHGLTDSPVGLYKGREFVFGKIEPGQTKKWTIDIELAAGVESRKDIVRVNFADGHQTDLGKLDIPALIEGLPKPEIAMDYQLEAPTTLGGLTTLKFTFKNLGKGRAIKPVALLKNETGPEVFIESGRAALKPMEPNTVQEATFAFEVKDPKLKEVKLEAQIFDAEMGAFWREQFVVPIGKSMRPVKRTPPKIVFTALPKNLSVPTDKFTINATISDDVPISDYMVFVNDQKIQFETNKDKRQKMLVKQMIDLKPGNNAITIIARENETYGSRGTLNIFSEKGDPFEKE